MIFHKFQPSAWGETAWELLVLVQGSGRRVPGGSGSLFTSERCSSFPREAVLIGASPDRMRSTWWRCSSSRSCLENEVRHPLHLWLWASASGLPAVATHLAWLCSRTQTKPVTCMSWLRTQRKRCHGCALPKGEIWVWISRGQGQKSSVGLSLSMKRVTTLFAPLALGSCP